MHNNHLSIAITNRTVAKQFHQNVTLHNIYVESAHCEPAIRFIFKTRYNKKFNLHVTNTFFIHIAEIYLYYIAMSFDYNTHL